MSLEHLITNRTSDDVDRVKTLAGKAWQDMTAEEQAEWKSAMKGAYNYTDMNRVEEAVTYVADMLRQYSYLSITPDVRNWSENDIPTADDFARYFNNIAILRRAIPVWEDTPTVPGRTGGFGATEANALEQILVDIDQILSHAREAWFASNELYSGEV